MRDKPALCALADQVTGTDLKSLPPAWVGSVPILCIAN